MRIPAKLTSKNTVSRTQPLVAQVEDKAEIEFVNRQRLFKLERKIITMLGRATLAKIARNHCSVTISFIRDREMRQLNRDYRGLDKPTDVLSFAYHEGLSDNEPNHNAGFLGDVIISVETAERYAREQGLSFTTEINWLVIHGILHLAGYDHETDNGEMRKLERRLRKELLNGQ